MVPNRIVWKQRYRQRSRMERCFNRLNLGWQPRSEWKTTGPVGGGC
ncbi:hypothetical protein [Streptomyces sp. NPDC058872]